MARTWSTIETLLRNGGGAALVTVTEARGSTPREAGARMVVAPDGSISGSIGGGTLEWQAMGAARQALASGARGTFRHRYALGPDLGQCCGGRADVAVECFRAEDIPDVAHMALLEASGGFETLTRFGTGGGMTMRQVVTGDLTVPVDLPVSGDGALIERFADSRHPVLLFGAGHVGRALVMALAPLPFSVTWIDSREDAFPRLVPDNVTPVRERNPTAAIAAAPGHALVIVMTHSHPIDLDICRAALSRAVFPYVGVIGSDTKRARFVSHLGSGGLADADIARLRCPIGVAGIADKEPAVIAAAVAAELLIARSQLRQSEARANQVVDNFTS